MHYLPVPMSCCQAVRVHVSLWCGRDAVAIHGSHHGVSPTFQQQTHKLKVTCKEKKTLAEFTCTQLDLPE